MIKPTMSHAMNQEHLNELLVKYYKIRTKELERKVYALEKLITECTEHGELDSSLFNAYMEHAIKQ